MGVGQPLNVFKLTDIYHIFSFKKKRYISHMLFVTMYGYVLVYMNITHDVLILRKQPTTWTLKGKIDLNVYMRLKIHRKVNTKKLWYDAVGNPLWWIKWSWKIKNVFFFLSFGLFAHPSKQTMTLLTCFLEKKHLVKYC